MTTAKYPLRPGNLGDAEAIARLHVAVWRETYRDLAPPDAFAALDDQHRLASWREKLSRFEGPVVSVAEYSRAVVAFAAYGYSELPGLPQKLEIMHLYVSSAHQRKGIGRRLMGGIAHRLSTSGARGVGLGVVVGNDAALVFYQSLGGRISGTYTDPGPLWRSKNHLVIWDDIPALVAATSAR
jgi:ribosomal protein S18 acetylase RimI-like enzyme